MPMPTPKYTLPTYSLDEIAQRGSTTIKMGVNGFWSEPVSIEVYQNTRRGGGVEWRIGVSHSAGGRDTSQVECDLEAECNFAHAVLAAITIAEDIKSNIPLIEKKFLEYEEIRIEKETERLKQKQALIDIDTELGIHSATTLINELISYPNSVLIAVYDRGSKTQSATIRVTDTARLRILEIDRFARYISRREAVSYLAHKSHRTNIVF